MVVRPALKAPRGEPRVRTLFEQWLEWPKWTGLRGCVFVSMAAELDDRTGPARDRLVQLQRDWLDTIAQVVRTAVDERHFRKDVDPDQFAHELHGVLLAAHHAIRLMRDPRAIGRTRTAFEALVARAHRS